MPTTKRPFFSRTYLLSFCTCLAGGFLGLLVAMVGGVRTVQVGETASGVRLFGLVTVDRRPSSGLTRGRCRLAIMHWWGVGTEAVWAWRKAFGIATDGTDGSRRLFQTAREEEGAKQRGNKVISRAAKGRS